MQRKLKPVNKSIDRQRLRRICRQTVAKSGGHADGQIILQERLTKDDTKTD